MGGDTGALAVMPATAAPSKTSSSSSDVASSSTTNTGQGAKSALARSLTGTLAFYFKRPVRLFRPTRISAWTAFTEMSAAQGHTSVNAGFLRTLISKQGWSFFFREAFPPLLANSIVGFTLFTTYTVTEAALKYFPSDPINPYYIPFISGATAGAAQSLISSPLDNVRAVLAARSAKPSTVEWKGWRHVAVEALFPKWLTTTIPFKQSPFRFILYWFRSTGSLFQFTLLRDSLGFAVFFSIFELSRSLAKRAGKAVDRFQANLRQKTQAIGFDFDLDAMLENDLAPRGWTGRVVQATVIVMTGIFAGVGYGIVGRPFDRARTIVWNGLEEWSRRTKRQAEEHARAEHSESGTNNTKEGVAPASKSPSDPKKAVKLLSHRSKHSSRLTQHENRLPLHPPRPTQPPKHPLKEPSIMYDHDQSGPSKPPSATALLLEAYKREGVLSMLGFSMSSGSNTTGHGVMSRSQLDKTKTRGPKPSNAASTAATSAGNLLERLAEHPALGGTSVFDNLPKQPKSVEAEEVPPQPKSHRKARLWLKARSRRKQVQEATASHARRWAKSLTVANVFRVIPPYCFGFLVYSIMAGDLSE
ncbi:hypothetical protein P389DRAFT_165167 [Cystobasidium minutum MCA 4210]|uniref:uncharacterized protein n=1 Tax=Cystobasidium minutum MCA 4210 TaxID=1397322 RepID=UPI0034CFF4EE|eukprot:jgi/Rhomi1/165167/fgenesh1_kg.1_\